MLSKTCVYGIQAAIYIASQPAGQLVNIQSVAENLNISFHFLVKVLQELTAAGLMTSKRGVTGGIMLAKPASEISIFDIVAVIDGRDMFEQCMIGLPGCGKAEPCPMHEHWTKLRARIAEVFLSMTLLDLAQDSQRLNLRLAYPQIVIR